MKKVKRVIISAIAATLMLAFAGASEAEAQGILREILDRMDKHYKALQTLQTNVSRTQYNAQLKETDNYSGRLILKPGKGRDVSMRLDWTRPREETLSVANGKYQIYVPGINRAYRGSTSNSKELEKKGGGVLKMISMSEAELRANFTPSYLGQVNLNGSEVWHVKLDPKTRQDFKFAELWVDKDGMPIQGRVTAHNNDTDTFQFSGIKRNGKINASVFTVKPVKGTEIIMQ